jgi:hypothetical protein
MTKQDPTNLPQNVIREADNIDVEAAEVEYFEIGQWYWVKKEVFNPSNIMIVPELAPEGYIELVCVTEVGSNYAEFSQIKVGNGYSLGRVHFNDMPNNILYEPNPNKYFQMFAGHFQSLTTGKMQEIAEITKSLNLSNTKEIVKQTNLLSNSNLSEQSVSTSIVPIGLNVEELKGNLITTKEVKLPALQEEIDKSNKAMVGWLSAPTMAATAMMKLVKETMVTIDDKIEDVSLYAGIGENCVIVKEGECAPSSEKITLMQRRCYMDEECLLDYLKGGIDIDKVEVFDNWLAKPENMERILPFEKCLVAFRVRRKAKYYGSSNAPMAQFIKSSLDYENKTTYLYIRNGQQLSRLETLIDFDEMLFENDAAHITQPLMAKKCPDFSKVSTMPKSEFEFLCQRQDELISLADKWEKANPTKQEPERDPFGRLRIKGVTYQASNPRLKEYRNERLDDFHPSSWKVLDSDHLYFDDVRKEQEATMRKYNKIAIILQGLMDRSTALSPIPKYDLSKHSDFSQALRLVSDEEMVLTYGEAPSFSEYQARLNSQAIEESVWVGQRLHWQLVTARKEQSKEDRKQYGRDLDPYLLDVNGNTGPQLVSLGKRLMPRAGKVTFEWSFRSTGRNYGELKTAKMSVPFSSLLNVSAYKLGDYKQFFRDPRTRHKYIEWAPLMLAAEEFLLSASKD